MKQKNTNFFKILTYFLYFVMVGVSLAVSAGEMETVSSVSSPLVNTATSESEVSLQSIWIFVAGLIGFIAMSHRKGI